MNWKVFWIAYAAGILVAVAGIYYAASNATKILAPADRLAELRLSNQQGQPVQIEDYHNRPLVVNYWATWCKPCIQEFPGFERLKQEYGGQVHFVMISDESTEKIGRFREKKSYSFEFLRSEKSLADMGITMIPLTYFYDTRGSLLNKQAGSLEDKELRKWIEQALNAKQ